MNERTAVRPELAAHIPRRVAALRVDRRGYPVPWFVQWFDGEPDFRVIDSAKLRRAVKQARCWICGDALGVNKSYVIGPMCVVNRISAEPPSHMDCARFAARACPFLVLPNAHRRDANLPADGGMNPAMLPHNPGVSAVWITRQQVSAVNNADGVVFRIGEPFSVEWFRQGRVATRDEVVTAFKFGLAKLIDYGRAQYGDDAVMTEAEAFTALQPYLPADASPSVATG